MAPAVNGWFLEFTEKCLQNNKIIFEILNNILVKNNILLVTLPFQYADFL